MPFFYYLPMPSLEPEVCQREASVKIVSLLVNPGTWISIDYPIALVTCGEFNYQILANGEGILRNFLKEEGSTLNFGENLAVVVADGESIPYGKPYSKAKKV